MQKKKQEGNKSLLSTFVTISVDNIGFLQSHAAIYSGDQHRSWQGTTVQALIHQEGNSTTSSSITALETSSETRPGDQSPPHSVEPNTSMQATQSLAAKSTDSLTCPATVQATLTLSHTSTGANATPTLSQTSSGLWITPSFSQSSSGLQITPSLSQTSTGAQATPILLQTSSGLRITPSLSQTSTGARATSTLSQTSSGLWITPSLSQTSTGAHATPTLIQTTSSLCQSIATETAMQAKMKTLRHQHNLKSMTSTPTTYRS